MITTFFLFFFTYLIGFIAGVLANKEKVGQIGEVVAKTRLPFPLIHPTPHPGGGRIPPKTPQQVQENNNPATKEVLDSMRETLDNIPELVADKEALQEAKKAEYGR